MKKFSTRSWGKTPYGEEATLYSVTNGKYSFTVSDYGAALVELFVPDRDGKPVDVVLGYQSAHQTNMRPSYLGVTVGRFANRIEKGRFTAGGKEYQLLINDRGNALHGGARGFSRRMFAAEPRPEEAAVVFTLHSPDGEDGYPGNLDLTVRYAMSDKGELSIRYEAVADRETPVNLTNHSYFNLYGAGSGKMTDGLMLSVDADSYAGAGADRLPDGRICPVRGTPMDLREPAALGDRVHSDFPAIRHYGGFDHAFLLIPREGLREAATLYCPENGIYMRCLTDLPVIQIFTRKPFKNRFLKYGAPLYAAVCLETEYCPNCLNYRYYPGDLLPAGVPLVTETRYAFSIR